ncbi:MAG: DUF1844 domain-containing protein [Promethearchaeota archaeon]
MSKTRKRKPRKSATTKSKPKAEPEPTSPKGEEETTERPTAVVDIAALPLWQILQVFLGIFDRVAWQRMGLVVNPQTQEIEKDMEQARIAIDCYEVLLKHLADKVKPEAKQYLETRLTDLKLNFASQA